MTTAAAPRSTSPRPSCSDDSRGRGAECPAPTRAQSRQPQREPPLRGADGSHKPKATLQSACVLARAVRSPSRARTAPGAPWCARSSPRGPTRINRLRVGGAVPPLGDSFSGGGAWRGGSQGGNRGGGGAVTHFAETTTSRGWAGGDSTRPRRGARRAHHQRSFRYEGFCGARDTTRTGCSFRRSSP